MAHEESNISNGFFHNPTTVSTSTAGDGSNPPPAKKKRNLPGNPDPEAEVIALSPKTLMATNRFLCEICGKGFQRDQNLQLHRRGHNLPWKLKQRSTKEPKKRVYVCPEKTCVHNHPSRALGDLTGIKKHFCRKHGEKKWKCEKCSKRYAVQSDWKAHSKTCGTREYRCDCGTLFSRRDSFITHRAFCDALAEETARVSAVSNINSTNILAAGNINYHFMAGTPQHFVFKPSSGNDHEPIITSNISQTNTTLGLPLWMSQGPQAHELSILSKSNNLQHQIHPLVSSVSSSPPVTLFGDPLVSCSNPRTCSDNNYQLNWVYRNKIVSSSSTHEELPRSTSNTSSLPLSNINKETTFGSQLVSIPSLYSSQQQNSHQNITSSSANMSATALLQKAAQIGATSSTDSSFLGSLGLKCNSSNIQLQEDENKFCGFYSSSNPISTSQGNNNINVEKAEDDYSFQMYSAAKTRKLQTDQETSTAGGGQTRDFLGVGQVQTICHPSSINGWI